MQRMIWITVAGVLGAALGVAPAWADSMRCGRRLVSSGASMYEVEAECGAPQARQQRTEWRAVRHYVRMPCGPGGSTMCTRAVEDMVEVQVEEWTYDFGRQRLLRFVTFEQGKLRSVATGGYGAR